jgi:hypothetical protein
MAWAQDKVRESELCGAELVPVANAQLQRARGEIQLARKLSKGGENERAESMLRRAAADAELAFALTQESQVDSPK